MVHLIKVTSRLYESRHAELEMLPICSLGEAAFDDDYYMPFWQSEGKLFVKFHAKVSIRRVLSPIQDCLAGPESHLCSRAG